MCLLFNKKTPVYHYKWLREGLSLRGGDQHPRDGLPPPPTHTQKQLGRDLLVNEIFTKNQALLTASARE
jgi:hypothetical protein